MTITRNTSSRRYLRPGLTWRQMMVVNVLLLLPIALLGIAARAWFQGSDQANTALLIRNAQQGLRSHT